jgi:uncharacterized protein YyaL (SSP411 family)
MAEAFANKRDEVEDSAASVIRAIEHNESFSGRGGGVLDEALLGKLVAAVVKQFDERNGGFGSQPKFPHPGALDLLLDATGRGDAAAKHVASVTLEKMAAGGIYDQLAGGFHRYSVDERWTVPHFEKMAYDNSELLKNYAHAWQSFGAEQGAEFARVAKDILRWMDEWLSDRELGGFYASQDADDSLDDDGDYFTWTRAEAEAVLTAEEFEVTAAFYDIGAVGDMHHNPQKNVLRRAMTLEAVAAAVKRDAAEVAASLRSAKEKLYAARLLRKTPYIDKTIYTGWNGMCIAAYLQAGRALGLQAPVKFALKSLDRVLAAVWGLDSDGASSLAHVVAYGEGVGAARIAGVLEDYAFVGNAALDAWEATGELRYFTVAREIGDQTLQRFCDSEEGDAMSRGFFDTERDEQAIGALSARRKPLQDSPTPAGNAVAATLLLRLHALTGEALYESRARDTLETFAGVVEHFGLYAASYGLALRRAVSGTVQVCVIGDDALAEELAAAALQGYGANKSVVRLRGDQLGDLPPALAETLPFLPGLEGSVAVVCRGNTCLPPVTTVEGLVAALAG